MNVLDKKGFGFRVDNLPGASREVGRVDPRSVLMHSVYGSPYVPKAIQGP